MCYLMLCAISVSSGAGMLGELVRTLYRSAMTRASRGISDRSGAMALRMIWSRSTSSSWDRALARCSPTPFANHSTENPVTVWIAKRLSGLGEAMVSLSHWLTKLLLILTLVILEMPAANVSCVRLESRRA